MIQVESQCKAFLDNHPTGQLDRSPFSTFSILKFLSSKFRNQQARLLLPVGSLIFTNANADAAPDAIIATDSTSC